MKITTNDRFTKAAQKIAAPDHIEIVAALLRSLSNLIDDVDDVSAGRLPEISAATECIARTSLARALGEK